MAIALSSCPFAPIVSSSHFTSCVKRISKVGQKNNILLSKCNICHIKCSSKSFSVLNFMSDNPAHCVFGQDCHMQWQQELFEGLHLDCFGGHKGRLGGRFRTRANLRKFSLKSFGSIPELGLDKENFDLAKLLSASLPYVVLVTAFSALIYPPTFLWVKKDYYAPALGGIMLSIGIQLSVQDFALILQRPMPILVGYMAQYIAKPLLGLLVARIFCMPTVFAAGFILTACVAGAQLSSYASYLSEGDVALSIVLTSLTTITSVIVTPLLTGLLLGSVIPVDGYAMAKSIMQVVLCPVLLGLALNTYAKPFVDKIRPFMPIMAMLCTSLCIGSPLALNRSSIASIQGLRLLFPVLAFHLSALAVGYWISKVPLWRQEEKACRTLSLCTGMQSSTLAGLLATQFLGGSHAVAPASSVVVMAVLGLGLASFWGKGHQIQTIWLGSGGKIKPFCRLI